MIAEKTLPEIDGRVAHGIKAPPLRVRKADIGDKVTYYISLICPRKRHSETCFSA